MLLESLPLASPNISRELAQTTSDLARSVFQELWTSFLPLIELLGGLLGIYIIIKLFGAISDHLMRKRIKRIDEKLQELDAKVDELLKNKKKKLK